MYSYIGKNQFHWSSLRDDIKKYSQDEIMCLVPEPKWVSGGFAKLHNNTWSAIEEAGIVEGHLSIYLNPSMASSDAHISLKWSQVHLTTTFITLDVPKFVYGIKKNHGLRGSAVGLSDFCS